MPEITSRLSTAKDNVLLHGIGSGVRCSSICTRHFFSVAILVSLAGATDIASQELHSCTRSPQASIREGFGRSPDITTVSLEGLVFGSPIPAGSPGLCYYRTTLVVEVRYRGDTRSGDARDPRNIGGVHWVLVSQISPETSNLQFVLTLDEGRQIFLEMHSYDQRRIGNEVAHHITAHMDGYTLTAVAGANIVELTVGQLKEVLSDEHLREIRRLARRVRL